MDLKSITFEKLIKKLVIPKVNRLFSKYGDIRITDVAVDILGEKWDDDHSTYIEVIVVDINYNSPLTSKYYHVFYYICYLILNASSFIFMDEIRLDIIHSTTDIDIDEFKFYSSPIGDSLPEGEALTYLQDELESISRK